MKHQCILHLGMSETGASPIQESMFTGLENPRFLYFGFVIPNGSRGVMSLFGDSPAEYLLNKNLSLSNIQTGLYRKDMHRHLEKTTQLASAHGKNMVFSAESAKSMNAGELLRYRRFIEERCYSVKTITYLRPGNSGWKAFSRIGLKVEEVSCYT